MGRARDALADYGLAIRWTECQQFDTNLGGTYQLCPLTHPETSMTECQRDRRPGALLQRGSRHRQGGARLPRRAARRRRVYVYDNNSKDRPWHAAREAGAVVRTERRQGKGNVVRRMFADIEADIYVLVDGDDTYDAAAAPAHGGRAGRAKGCRHRLGPPRSHVRRPPIAPAMCWATGC